MNNLEVSHGFAVKSAAKGEEIKLAMQRLWLVGRILPVGARLLVRHTFKSAEKKPLEVIYSFVLPREAALRRFRITGEGFAVRSELKPVEEAVKAYEEGLAKGHLSSMARQYQDGLINLTIGNIHPGEEVRVDLEILAGVENHDGGLRFRFPFALAPGYHSRARMAEVRPGAGEIELPEDEFGDVILPQFVSNGSALHEVGFDLSVAMGGEIVETASPSHAVKISGGTGPGRQRISLATAKDVPDRDLVLDISTREKRGGVLAGTGSDGKGYFAVVLPSAQFGEKSTEPRRIVFVLDRSGSMGGAPMQQARAALEACLGALGAEDQFGIVAFDSTTEAFGGGLVTATMDNRNKAKAFLTGIDARGGTELANALRTSAKLFDKQGGDIMLLTDGQVFGTDDILAGTRSTGLRVHCLGIGSASRDYFLSRIAAQTGGICRSVTTRERVDLTAVDLFSGIGRPLATDLEVRVEGFSGSSISPEPQKIVFDGSPVVVFGETSGPGDGRLVLEWTSGGGKRSMVLPISIVRGRERDGETLRLLQGSRLIAELEGSLGQETAGKLEKRQLKRNEARLMELSETYGLACRLMALVAVVERLGDKSGAPPVTRVVPIGMPQDVDYDSYFAGTLPLLDAKVCYSILPARSGRGIKPPLGAPLDLSMAEPPDKSGAELMALASRIQPDGGMPGDVDEERALATVLAILRFLAEGHSARRGAFREHVRRLMEFLEKSPVQNDVVRAVISRVRSGKPVDGELWKRSPEPSLWAELAKALDI